MYLQNFVNKPSQSFIPSIIGAIMVQPFRFWGFILILLAFTLATSPGQETKQKFTISGTVTDAKTGEALAGVNVLVRGTTLGTSSRPDGSYALLVSLAPGTYRIQFGLLGFKSKLKDVALGGTEAVDIGSVGLEEDLLKIQEIIVTGTGTAVEKEKLANSVATVSGSSISGAATPTIDAALAGKIPGAQVLVNSGTPGGGVSVRLRGTSTISASAEPLYIVDGVIVDNSSNELVNLGGYVGNRIADLEPNDVDHIEVVKGAAAAALYGSRANNGVIQIFTKRGHQGAPRITFGTRGGTSKIRKTYDVNLYPFDKPPSDPTRKAVTRLDYQNEIFRRGYEFENFLSVAGGNEQTKYYVSGSHGYETGIVKATDYRKINFRANIDQRMSDWLTLSVGGNYIHSNSERVPNGGIVGGEGVITNFAFQPNWFDLHGNSEGKFPAPPQAAFANELEVIGLWKSPLEVNRFIGGLQLTALPTSSISLDYKLGYDSYTERASRQIPIGSSAGYTTGFSQESVQEVQLINNDIVASHHASMNDYGFTTTLGFSHQYSEGTNVNASVRDLIPVALLLSSGATATAGGFLEKRVIYGSFIQETIGYQDKLFLTGALRADAASTFGKDDRWQFFPKASLSYVISAEPFWAETFGETLNRFKLRTAWGASGGQPAGTYDRFSVYVQQSNSGRPGLVNSTLLGNETLKPERMTEIELGADFGMFNDRLSVEASYYSKNIKDLLLVRSLPPSTGYAGVLDNVGELENKGFELLIKGVIFNTEDFQWVSTGTLSHNENKVTKLNGPAFAVANSFNIARVAEGEPLGFFYGPTYTRSADGSIAHDTLGRPIRNPVNSKIGDPNPDIVASLINDFQIGNLSIRVQLDGMFGQDVFNFTRRILETPAFGNGKLYEKELSGEVATGFFNARRTIFEEYIEDGSFVKLREVSVGYTFNDDWVKGLGINSFTLTFIGRNLFSIDNYSGYDPEVNVAAQSTLVRGFDWSTIPIPRTFILNFTANF